MLRAQFVQNLNGSAVVAAQNAMGNVHIRVLPMAYEDFLEAHQQYKQGALIQQAFPNLSSTDREFLQTGMTPLGWYQVFGDEEGDDSNRRDAVDEGQYFLTPEQYQLVYAGEKSLEEVYAYNRRQIEAKLAEQGDELAH